MCSWKAPCSPQAIHQHELCVNDTEKLVVTACKIATPPCSQRNWFHSIGTMSGLMAHGFSILLQNAIAIMIFPQSVVYILLLPPPCVPTLILQINMHLMLGLYRCAKSISCLTRRTKPFWQQPGYPSCFFCCDARSHVVWSMLLWDMYLSVPAMYVFVLVPLIYGFICHNSTNTSLPYATPLYIFMCASLIGSLCSWHSLSDMYTTFLVYQRVRTRARTHKRHECTLMNIITKAVLMLYFSLKKSPICLCVWRHLH